MRTHFARNEEMRTEISTKFTRERLEASYADAGLELVEWWTDPDELYALSLAKPPLAAVVALSDRVAPAWTTRGSTSGGWPSASTSSIVLIVAILFFPWYELEPNPQRAVNGPDFNPDAFVCGEGEFECTGFETFPIMRWLLLLTALAPLILAYIIARGHKLSYPPGEMTMVAGFTAFVLIFYNGIIDKPGATVAETGVSLKWGYWVALLAAAAIAAVGFTRSLESGGKQKRKAPGTV